MKDFDPHSIRTVNGDFSVRNVIEMRGVILVTCQENWNINFVDFIYDI